MSVVEGFAVRDHPAPKRHGDVVLGDDWVAPEGSVDGELQRRRERQGVLSLNRSPLARKIITFNLMAIMILVAGVLYLSSSRDSLLTQRADALVAEAELIADVIEAQMPGSGPVNLAAGDGVDVLRTLDGLDLRQGLEVLVFDAEGRMIAQTEGSGLQSEILGLAKRDEPTVISDFLDSVWDGLARVFTAPDAPVDDDTMLMDSARAMIGNPTEMRTRVQTGTDGSGDTLFLVATPIEQGGRVVGAIAVSSAAGEIDRLVRSEREQVLQMFVIAILVSVGLSLVLASTIANPLADLAAAAEIGRARNSTAVSPARIRIPDLTARPDEIGRLSGALRGMVSALYDRIEGNEQFAADVAHEIKNPLASLRSAVGSLRFVKKEEQREKLLDVIDHDVRRLDRLVSDISNASRLDSELVKEDEEPFNLLDMLGNLNRYLGEEAQAKGVDFISDLPSEPIIIHGLEARLAQVFVNLISNATSFCEEGDAIRVWARRRENRVLVVVEDTGPGIPEEALTKIFKRFYSQRPEGQFGNNSGLGLAISKQIVEAHGGVIWAENIRPTDADPMSEPLGARFVVGLPI